MSSWWVKVSQSFMVDLPKDRPFTRLEAAYSLAIDQFNNRPFSLRGYARLWQWSTGKVSRFMEDFSNEDDTDQTIKNNQNGETEARQKRDSDETPKELINTMLQDAKEQKQDKGETEARRTIIEKKREDLFGQFWSVYPKKKNKALALKTWNRLNPSLELLTEILTALDWQCQQPDWKKAGGQYIPHPSSWLNNGGWEDERPTQQTTADSTATQRSNREELRAKGIDI